ncbi:hypothetical protein [Paenibacillus ginsengihumi]|uniref:hypothetical protein n=1 Tax=Paenibacillus ginsengihumi TaxID=431596 RepID=UPI000377A970|nr:hypothetical protein [Paenibacillus ginsengihumi]
MIKRSFGRKCPEMSHLKSVIIMQTGISMRPGFTISILLAPAAIWRLLFGKEWQ